MAHDAGPFMYRIWCCACFSDSLRIEPRSDCPESKRTTCNKATTIFRVAWRTSQNSGLASAVILRDTAVPRRRTPALGRVRDMHLQAWRPVPRPRLARLAALVIDFGPHTVQPAVAPTTVKFSK